MTENIVLEILSAFIHNRKPCFSCDTHEGKIFYFFYIQGILPVLAYMDKKWDIIKDENMKKKLVDCYYQAIAENFNKTNMFEIISQKLSESKIPHMPVKGWYLRSLYPVPELRTFGDIDILINKQDRQKTDEIFIKNGYSVKENWEPTYTYNKGLSKCEVHTELMDSDLGKGKQVISYFSNALETAENDVGERFSPQKDLHLIYLFCHLAKHLYTGGAGIRMYMDITLFLKAYAGIFDFEKISEDFKKLNLDRFFKTVVFACSEWFQIDLPFEINDITPDSLEALKKYTFGADLFGKTRDKSIISLRNDEFGSKESVLKDTLFPNAKKIEERYKFIKGRKYLLPLAWIARSFVNLKEAPRKLKYIKKVSNADMDLVGEYNEFISNIGL
ncbi:MAG: nucleotidyltransferase family protein [Acutalibacteraceae bacterium]|nr:nucleotidyltransferase family protein [Acutalibacteraceae bacterium]